MSRFHPYSNNKFYLSSSEETYFPAITLHILESYPTNSYSCCDCRLNVILDNQIFCMIKKMLKLMLRTKQCARLWTLVFFTNLSNSLKKSVIFFLDVRRLSFQGSHDSQLLQRILPFSHTNAMPFPEHRSPQNGQQWGFHLLVLFQHRHHLYVCLTPGSQFHRH